jgi:8-oxo-dGTP diphosphatase
VKSAESDRDYQAPRLRSSIIARNSDGRVLLLEHIRPYGRYLVLPGGGVKYGETIEQALIREMHEELDARCIIDRLVAVGELFLPGRHVVDFFFAGSIEKDGPFKILHSEGIGKAEWISPDELDDVNFLPPEVIPVIRKVDDMESGEIEYLGRYRIHERKVDNPDIV